MPESDSAHWYAGPIADASVVCVHCLVKPGAGSTVPAAVAALTYVCLGGTALHGMHLPTQTPHHACIAIALPCKPHTKSDIR